jgi:hypothetical protein
MANPFSRLDQSALNASLMGAGFSVLANNPPRPISQGPNTFGSALGHGGLAGMQMYQALTAAPKYEYRTVRGVGLVRVDPRDGSVTVAQPETARRSAKTHNVSGVGLVEVGEDGTVKTLVPSKSGYTPVTLFGPNGAQRQGVVDKEGRRFFMDSVTGNITPASAGWTAKEHDKPDSGEKKTADERTAALLGRAADASDKWFNENRAFVESAFDEVTYFSAPNQLNNSIIEGRRAYGSLPKHLQKVARRLGYGPEEDAPPINYPGPGAGEDAYDTRYETKLGDSKADRAKEQANADIDRAMAYIKEIAGDIAELERNPTPGIMSELPGTESSGIEGSVRRATSGVLRQVLPDTAARAVGLDQNARTEGLDLKYKILAFEMVAPITKETSRFSDKERAAVERIVGRINPGDDITEQKKHLLELAAYLDRLRED